MKTSIMTLSLLAMSTFVQAAPLSNPEAFSVTSSAPHKVVLLNHGLASLEERLQMIERAQKSIDVEYFIYRTDKSAKIFTQALVKKAREGVKVRMLLDYFMVKMDLSPFFTHELEQEGIEIKYFNTTSTLNLFSGQYRNHRKVLIVDGKEAITGGRNIGDEYFDLGKDYNFLDRDVHIEGEVVSSIQKTFDETFKAKLSEKVARAAKPDQNDQRYNRGDAGQDTYQFENDLRIWNKSVAEAKAFISAPLNEKMEEGIRAKGKEELASEFTGECAGMSFHSEYPNIGKENRKENRILKHDIFKRIKNAKESIMIDSPYFIVNDELAEALDAALNKKVNVKLLTNSLNSTDAIYVYAAFDSIVKSWLDKGLESHIFKGERPKTYEVMEEHSGKARFGVHAKTFVFDNEDVIIGTYNVDPRSANYNSEMIVSCDNSPKFAEEVKKDIDSRIDGSIHLDSAKTIKDAEFFQIGFGKKILYYITKIPANIFDYLL